MKVSDLFTSLMCSLYSQGTISVVQEAKALGATEDDIRACLEPLVFCFDAVGIRMEIEQEYARLIYDKKNRNLRLTPPEISALIDALQKFGIEKEDELVQKLISARSYGETLAEIMDYPIITAQANAPSNFIRELSVACDDSANYVLHIMYKGENDTEARLRVVQAYSIMSSLGKNYLRCFLLETGQQRLFKLSRIQSVELVQEKHDVFKWKDENSAQYNARIAFSADCTIPNWPGLKCIKERDDGSSVYRISWFGNNWLPKQIVSMLGKAKPLEPPQLIEKTTELIDEYLSA